MATGTNVGDTSPYTGHKIVEVINLDKPKSSSNEIGTGHATVISRTREYTQLSDLGKQQASSGGHRHPTEQTSTLKSSTVASSPMDTTQQSIQPKANTFQESQTQYQIKQQEQQQAQAKLQETLAQRGVTPSTKITITPTPEFVKQQMKDKRISTGVKQITPAPETKGYEKGTSVLEETKIEIPLIEKAESFAKQQEQKGTIIGTALATGVAVGEVGLGIGQVVASPIIITKGLITKPTETISSIINVPAQLEAFKQQTVKTPLISIGNVVGGLFGGELVAGIGKPIRSTYIKTGSKFVPPEKTFASEVLKEKATFPLTSSSAQTIKRIGATELEGKQFVVTASQEPLKGKIVGKGGRAAAGLEDPGIYVTSKGRGSPYFLGTKQTSSDLLYSDLSISINPFAIYKPKTPSLSEFEVSKAITLPKEITKVAGFSEVEKFQQSLTDKGIAIVTKRSQIGTGELRPKYFYDEKGNLIREAGTVEEEAVIPIGAEIKQIRPETGLAKFKGYSEYTTSEGYAVPIRKYKIVGETDKVPILETAVPKKEISSYEYKPKISSPIIPKEPIYLSSSKKVSSKVSPVSSSISSSVSEISNYSISSSSIESSGISTGESYPSKTSSEGSSISTPSYKPSEISSYTSESSKVSGYSPSSYSSRGYSEIFVPPEYQLKKPIYILKKEYKKKKKGFRVEVRRKGVFQEIKDTFATEKEAMAFGFEKVKKSAAATYKIKPVDYEPSKKFQGKINYNELYAKKEKGQTLYIQKSKFRISTPEEKKEITYKGIQARKLKTLFS